MKIAYKCSCCGHDNRYAEQRQLLPGAPDPSGNIRYYCSECAKVQRYSTLNTTHKGKDKAFSLSVSFEFECVPYSEECYRQLLQGRYNYCPCSDSSLPRGGVEFKTPIYHNFSGRKQEWATIIKLADFQNSQCGQHIHIGDRTWGEFEGHAIAQHWEDIFGKLADECYENAEDTARFWGRGYNHFASYREDSPRGHYNAFHVCSDHIEFRICKLVDPDQYFAVASFCEAICKLINVWGFQRLQWNKVGDKVLAQYRKYIAGEAHCQRPERNQRRRG